MNRSLESPPSTMTALLVGIAIGMSVVFLYLVSGLTIAEWDVSDVIAHLTLETIGTFLLLGVLTVGTFAIPIAAYARLRLLAPAVILGVVLLGWFGFAVSTGTLTADDVFGLGLYAIGLSPLYFVCYAVASGVEYVARRRVAA